MRKKPSVNRAGRLGPFGAAGSLVDAPAEYRKLYGRELVALKRDPRTGLVIPAKFPENLKKLYSPSRKK